MAGKTQMKRQAGLKKAQLLVELAKHSVGTHQALDAYKLHLEQLIEEFDLQQPNLNELKKKSPRSLNKLLSRESYLPLKESVKFHLQAF